MLGLFHILKLSVESLHNSLVVGLDVGTGTGAILETKSQESQVTGHESLAICSASQISLTFSFFSNHLQFMLGLFHILKLSVESLHNSLGV